MFAQPEQGAITGFRLDGRRAGSVDSPSPLPECPKCKFVIPTATEGNFSRTEIRVLKRFVDSPRYKTALDETTYFRSAVILETLMRPSSDIAQAYLEASWQVDNDSTRTAVYLVRCLCWLDAELQERASDDAARARAMLLKAEVLRRLSRFDEARSYLEELEWHRAITDPRDKSTIQQELDLVALADSEPHLAIVDDARVHIVSVRVTSPGVTLSSPHRVDGRLPIFPSGTYAARISGTAVVAMTVSPSGTVVHSQVKAATMNEFGASANRAMATWAFAPLLVNGHPATVQLECTVRFDVND